MVVPGLPAGAFVASTIAPSSSGHGSEMAVGGEGGGGVVPGPTPPAGADVASTAPPPPDEAGLPVGAAIATGVDGTATVGRGTGERTGAAAAIVGAAVVVGAGAGGRTGNTGTSSGETTGDRVTLPMGGRVVTTPNAGFLVGRTGSLPSTSDAGAAVGDVVGGGVGGNDPPGAPGAS